jgi:hypothetical protein
MRKLSRKGMIKKLDKVHREVLLLKYGEMCVECGSTKMVTVGHVFSRRTYETRWDIDDGGNCYPQCWACNYKHVRDQYPYFKWFTDKFGADSLEMLRERFHASPKPWKMYDFEREMEYLLNWRNT